MERTNDSTRTPSAATRRLLGGALLAVGVGVLIGWAIFHGGGDDSGRAGAAAPVTVPGAQAAPARFNQFGITFQRPAGWSTEIKEGVLNVAAPDRTVVLTVSKPPGKPDVRELRGNDREELKKLFDAKEVQRRRFSVGPLDTLVTEMLGKTRTGRKVRILSMGVSSKWATYSIQVFSAPKLSAQRALELQSLINSFKFHKPK